MQHKLIAALPISVLLVMSGSAISAEAPSWNYLSLEGVVSGDIEFNSAKEDIDGFRWEAAKAFGDFVMIRAGNNAYHIGAGGLKFDFATNQVGLGAHYSIAQTTIPVDIWASVNYERITLEGLLGVGPGLDVGVRSMLTPMIELGVTGKVLSDVDFGNSVTADYTGYSVYGDFFVTPNVAVQASFSDYELDPDNIPGKFDYSSIVGLGVRFDY